MTYFSFIIPVYNVEKYLEKCIDSILQQSYKNFEVILIDDGSTDNSGDICDKYAQIDDRVKVHHITNQGQSKARNKGLHLAKGKYIIFLDSDDYWVADKLEKIYLSCSNNNADIVVFNYEVYEESLEKLIIPKAVNFENTIGKVLSGEEFLQKAIEKNTLYGWYAWFYAIKTDLLLNNDFDFKVNMKYEDVELMYKIIIAAKSVVALDEIVMRYRLGRPGATTNVVKLQTEKDKLEVVRRNINNVQEMDINRELKVLLSDNFSCLYYSAAILCNDLEMQSEVNELQKDLKDTLWVGKYTKQKNQKIVYYLANILGIKATCWLLNKRKQMKKGK